MAKQNRINDGSCYVTDSCVTSHDNEKKSVTFYASSQIPDMWAMTSSATSSAASVANGAKRHETVNCDKTYDELGSSPIVNAVNDAVTVAGTDGNL